MRLLNNGSFLINKLKVNGKCVFKMAQSHRLDREVEF